MLVNNFFPDNAASSTGINISNITNIIVIIYYYYPTIIDDISGPKDATETRAVSIQDMPVLYQGIISSSHYHHNNHNNHHQDYFQMTHLSNCHHYEDFVDCYLLRTILLVRLLSSSS
jgi:hypothetical protein